MTESNPDGFSKKLHEPDSDVDVREDHSGDNENYLTQQSGYSVCYILGMFVISTVQTRLSMIISHTYLHHNCFLTSHKHELLNAQTGLKAWVL